MEKKIILLDTSILIEYFRKTDKSKSQLFKLSANNQYTLAVSAITKFEIYNGINKQQEEFWNLFFNSIIVLPFEAETALIASAIDADLKRKRKQIAIPDLFIAATAVQANCKIATHNKKHFERIEKLKLV